MKTSTPLIAAGMAVIFLGFAVVLLLFSNPGAQLSTITVIALIVSTMPSLIAAVFSERVSKDIRNGVVVESARQGAEAAIQQILPSTVIKDDKDTVKREGL